MVEQLAEGALLLHFGNAIDPSINARVHAAARALRVAGLPGIVDIAPAYASLLLRFSAPVQDSAAIEARLRDVINADAHADHNAPACVLEIPVCYGGNFGPDLDVVAAHAGIKPAAVIERHTGVGYTVAMLGFAPGFPYMLGMDPALHMPRRDDPRTRVPAGSVAIGGAQTGIYPKELPGGWNLIGRTPWALFDPRRDPPALLAPGDRVRFHAIDPDEFAALAGRGA